MAAASSRMTRPGPRPARPRCGQHDVARRPFDQGDAQPCSSFFSWVESVGWLTWHAAAARPKWWWSPTAHQALEVAEVHARRPRLRCSIRLGRAGVRMRWSEGAQGGGGTRTHGDHDLLVRRTVVQSPAANTPGTEV